MVPACIENATIIDIHQGRLIEAIEQLDKTKKLLCIPVVQELAAKKHAN
jgi:hypothetical protein